MIRSISPFLATAPLFVAALTLAACRSTDSAAVDAVDSTPEPVEYQVFAVQGPTGTPEVTEESPSFSRNYDLAGGEQALSESSLWRDPDFRRRFTESYLADTTVEPTIPLEENETLQKVSEYIADSEYEKAISLLRKKGGPRASAVFDYTLGQLYMEREELELAAGAYGRAVGKFTKYRRAWRNLGIVHVRLDQQREASEALIRVIELGGGDALTYGLLGIAHLRLENFVAAESALRMATLLDPATFDWKLGLARSFFKQHRYAEAAALSGHLIEGDPDSADLWTLQAHAYIGMGQPLRAAQNFELVDRLGESSAGSLNNLGDIYVNEGLFDVAVDAYVRALHLDEGAGVTRPLRAARTITANGGTEDVKRLIAAIQETQGEVLLPEERKQILQLEARVASATGDDEERTRVLEELVQLDPLDGDALIRLGEQYASADRPEEAIFRYEHAADIEGFEALAKRRHGQLLVTLERYDEALPLLRESLALQPTAALEDYTSQVERLARTAVRN